MISGGIATGRSAADSEKKSGGKKKKKKAAVLKPMEEEKAVEGLKPVVAKRVTAAAAKRAEPVPVGTRPFPAKVAAKRVVAKGVPVSERSLAPEQKLVPADVAPIEEPVEAPVPVEPVPVAPVPVEPEAAGAAELLEIPVAKVVVNPHQPRKSFDEETLRELAESIRAEGLLQPIVVRRKEQLFELIAGERRWRACQMLKLKLIPARILDVSEISSAVLSLIENLQREDLNPLEESMGYASLIKDFDLTQEQVAERVGRSRATVANMLRLLQLPKELKGYLAKGLISTGHAKVLLGMEDAALQQMLARQIIEKGWSVRETERQVQVARAPKNPAVAPQRSPAAAELTAIRELQSQLATALSTPVTLKHAPRKGKIVIEYFGNDDLQRIIDRIGL